MAPTALDPSTPLQMGARYTFQFSQSAVPFVAANNNEITDAVVKGMPNITGVAVSGESTFGGQIEISFTYNDPDNNDPVGAFGQQMAMQASSAFTLDNLTFVMGFGGPSGTLGDPNADATGLATGLKDVSSVLMWAVIAIIVVVVAVRFL